MESELVKMSPKGQLVVPQTMRNQEGFNPGDRFIPFYVKGGILFKKVKMPNPAREFAKLSKDISLEFKKRKVNQEEVSDAIQWARKQK